MNTDTIRENRKKTVERFGEWTAHNVHIVDDLYTIGPDAGFGKLPRLLQVVSDIAGKPLKDLRILDLACLEGGFAIEFARHGAEVVGIEIREASIKKGQFVKEALGLDNLTFHQDDILNLSAEKYGTFDVILCIGIFYHLDFPDLIKLTHQMFHVCRKALIMDTYVGLTPRERFQFDGREYCGLSVVEHRSDATPEQRESDLWASFNNTRSVWLTRASLLNLFAHAGFTSAYECHNPSEVGKLCDRVTMVAIKGEKPQLLSSPLAAGGPMEDWPEKRQLKANAVQGRYYHISKTVSKLVPRPFKNVCKAILRKMGIIRSPSLPWEWRKPWKSRGENA